MGQRLLRVWHFLLELLFAWSIYHLIRDFLQDILNIHNLFTEFIHYEANSSRIPRLLRWTYLSGPLGKYSTIPLAILALIFIPRLLRQKLFTRYDGLAVLVILYCLLTYALNIVYDYRKF
ncbi:MAG: hypothetical protein Q8N84_00205 [bacterium]|nr:hypothetical protein [bacterium]